MKTSDFTSTFLVNQTPEEVFNAINNVRAWWKGDIKGSTDKLGGVFTYRYKPYHYSKQKVTELIPGKKVVWHVVESKLNFIEDKSEWDGTNIIFKIAKKGSKTVIRFTHVGLVHDRECYDACSGGWTTYIDGSLKKFITNGEDKPVRKVVKKKAAKKK